MESREKDLESMGMDTGMAMDMDIQKKKKVIDGGKGFLKVKNLPKKGSVNLNLPDPER